MTCKVIRVNRDGAMLGFPDGTFKLVSFGDLGFIPEINDLVDIYVNGDSVVYVMHESSFSSAFNTKSLDSVFGSKRRVDKVVYCVLAFLLGGLGVHKFYAGKMFLGILYVLLCWTFIPAIVAVIEGIIALCQDADSRGRILV